ncbi:MAG: caspase family protein [Anaerolineae bacterium]|nr:caspase family protein [Anaerolineae bacterium]
MEETTYHDRYGQSYALVIGIDQYDALPPLKTAVRGAEAVASWLRDDGFEVTTLCNEAATREAILGHIDSAFCATSPDDRLVIYFAGHGFTRQTTTGSPVGFLMPYGVRPGQYHRAIEMDDLVDRSKFIPAKHILFLLDACFSGLAFTRSVSMGRRLVADLVSRRAVQAIAAGQADQVVLDLYGPEGHSMFTGLLLDRLNKRGGMLTANELGLYLQREVGSNTHSRQTPHYGHLLGSGGGDFVFWADEPIRHLPPEISVAIESPLTGVREGVIRELASILRGSDPALAELAREALLHLSEDDSRRVSYAARAVLGMGPTLTQQGGGPAPGVKGRAAPTVPVSADRIEKRLKRQRESGAGRLETAEIKPAARSAESPALSLLRRFWPVLAILVGLTALIYDMTRSLDDNRWYLSTVAILVAVGVVRAIQQRWWQAGAFVVGALIWIIPAMYYQWNVEELFDLYDFRFVPPLIIASLLIWVVVDGFLPQKS